MPCIHKKMKKILLSISLLFVGCQTEKLHFIEGEAQGSTYHIKYISSNNENLQPAIDSILKVIDQSMSTYKPDSDISKINAGDTSVVVDKHFRKVFEASQQIWQESEGLFDPTVGVLVNAWGFGKQKIDNKDLPTDEKIVELKKYVGFNKVQLTDNNHIKKEYPEILFDFNAIAQGYTSDVVADFLNSKGIKNYIVEIAGEMFLKGKNTDYPWRTKSPLQGFARCPTCNHILGLTQSKFKRPDGSMRIHKYFHCRICKCNNVEHKNSRVDKLEEQVLSLIKEKYGEVEVKLKEKISIKDIEKKIEKLQAKKMSDFEKYKLGKMTKVKFVESKNQIDNEISKLEEKIKLSSNETEVVTDNELTRELMEKYVESVICEGSIVQKIIWK